MKNRKIELGGQNRKEQKLKKDEKLKIRGGRFFVKILAYFKEKR